MNKTNWGIIATGSIAAKLAEAINSNENSVLYAVASRSENKAKDFAEKFGAIKQPKQFCVEIIFSSSICSSLKPVVPITIFILLFKQ